MQRAPGRRALLAAGAASAFPVRAQDWPARAVRWVVGYPPGGASDVMARLFGQAITTRIGQPVVIDNRPGGGAVLATETVTRAPADGYTLLTVDNGILVYNPVLYAKLPFDPDRDLVPVGFIGRFPLMILVRPDHPARDFAALVAASGQAPDALTYGTPGVASPHHLAMEMVKRRTGLSATHVPYRGGPPAMNDLLAGLVDVAVMDTSTGLPFVTSGRARPLAALTERRSAMLPDVPTLVELGHADAVAYGWQGVGVAAGTPDAMVARLNAELVAAAALPEVAARLRAIGVETDPADAAAFRGFVAREIAIWRPLIRELGLRIDN